MKLASIYNLTGNSVPLGFLVVEVAGGFVLDEADVWLIICGFWWLVEIGIVQL